MAALLGLVLLLDALVAVVVRAAGASLLGG
jgi:hypothetical protein